MQLVFTQAYFVCSSWLCVDVFFTVRVPACFRKACLCVGGYSNVWINKPTYAGECLSPAATLSTCVVRYIWIPICAYSCVSVLVWATVYYFINLFFLVMCRHLCLSACVCLMDGNPPPPNCSQAVPSLDLVFSTGWGNLSHWLSRAMQIVPTACKRHGNVCVLYECW